LTTFFTAFFTAFLTFAFFLAAIRFTSFF
jgi:hypothetical protein